MLTFSVRVECRLSCTLVTFSLERYEQRPSSWTKLLRQSILFVESQVCDNSIIMLFAANSRALLLSTTFKKIVWKNCLESQSSFSLSLKRPQIKVLKLIWLIDVSPVFIIMTRMMLVLVLFLADNSILG